MKSATLGQLFLHGLSPSNGLLDNSLDSILSFSKSRSRNFCARPSKYPITCLKHSLKIWLPNWKWKRANQVNIQGEMWAISNFIGSCQEQSLYITLSISLLGTFPIVLSMVIHPIILRCMKNQLRLLQWCNVRTCLWWVPTCEPQWKSKGIKTGHERGTKYFQLYWVWHSLDMSLTPFNFLFTNML